MITIYEWQILNRKQQQQILNRPSTQASEEVLAQTSQILSQVKTSGDAALRMLTAKFDRVVLDNLLVHIDEIKNAKDNVSKADKAAILFAKEAITANHQAQLPETKKINTNMGIECIRAPRPIEKVGLYVPGGTAPLVSTVLMLAIPAQIAQCPTRILCTPALPTGNIDPRILFAAEVCGIEKIYKVGGAQAIAAMAYGTESISKVDKIFGPGNQWVTTAKAILAQSLHVAIDMPAGPSEVLVIADDAANPEWVAADLLSQAEHGTDSQVVLITLSKAFAEATLDALISQLKYLPRSKIALQALQHSRFIVAENLLQAIEISNCYAPEHLILQIENAEDYCHHIQHAGAVFVGKWSPETLGDYVTGSNHVLPTGGLARSYSGLSITDFMKFINIQKVNEQGLLTVGAHAQQLADIEGLGAHKNAVSLRIKEATK